jgi:DNA polymerase-3 subunit epsilon
VLVRAVRRRQRLESLAAVPELVLARPDGEGGWQLSVVRRGRLVSAGNAPRGTSVRGTLPGLLATAETLTGPDDEPAASVDETELIMRWIEKPGTRLVQVEGTLACPAPGTGPFTGFLAQVEASREQRDPFGDTRSLSTRARPDRVAPIRPATRLGSPA